MTSVGRISSRALVAHLRRAVGEGFALANAACKHRYRGDQARHHDAFPLALADAPAREECQANAIVAYLLDLPDALAERVRNDRRVDKFGKAAPFYVRGHYSPQSVSLEWIVRGAGEARPSTIRNTVNGSARGGPSLAGTGCDAVSEAEAQLPRPRPKVLAHILSPAAARPRVGADVNELRWRDGAFHRRLPVRAGENPRLQSRALLLEPVASGGEQAEPVTAQRAFSRDSQNHCKTGVSSWPAS